MTSSSTPGRRLRIFTWHIHGSYLFYLSQGNYDLFIPVNKERNEGYYGRGSTFPFGNNVTEVPAEEVRNMQFDCILYQSTKNFLADQYEVLSEAQRKLPRIYVEHNTPDSHPTDTRHPMNDPQVCIVHVTPFNKLMYYNTVPMVEVIDHGITPQGVNYTGEINKGIVVVNHLHQRGRKLGGDIYDVIRKQVPVELVGMGTEEYGGLGEVLHPNLPAFTARYRFMFNPIRYTSLGLAVLEAMMRGIPVVALATTEYVTVIKDGVSGFIHTDVDYLVQKMKCLLDNPLLAAEIGANGKAVAEERFHIQTFTRNWERLFNRMTSVNAKQYTYEKENSIY
jgi:hypothetical protein